MPPEDTGDIVRINHNQDKWFQLSRALAQDRTISYALRGLLAYLISKPNGWQVNTSDLIKASPAGRDKTYSLLKEGENRGYMSRRRERKEGGHFQWVTNVYESPALNPYLNQDEDDPTTSGFSVSGESRSGESRSGESRSGESRSGKAGHIEYTDLDYTDLEETEEEETEGEETEGQNDDDDGFVSTLPLMDAGGVQGGVTVAAMRTFAAESAANLLGDTWDGQERAIQRMGDEQLIALVEWLDYYDEHYERLSKKLDNPVGYILSRVKQGIRPANLAPNLDQRILDNDIPRRRHFANDGEALAAAWDRFIGGTP